MACRCPRRGRRSASTWLRTASSETPATPAPWRRRRRLRRADRAGGARSRCSRGPGGAPPPGQDDDPAGAISEALEHARQSCARGPRRRRVIRRVRCPARAPRLGAVRRRRPARSGLRRGGAPGGTRSASPTTGPGCTPRNSITSLPSSGGWILSSSSCSAQLGDARLELVHAAGERLRLALVARRAVAAGQLVELVEQVAGVAHVAADRAVGPAHAVRVEAQVQVHELGDVFDDLVRVPQREEPLLRHAARRPPRGGGTSHRCR